MSVAIEARTVLDFALLQSAAECYLDGFTPKTNQEAVQDKLTEGANNALKQGTSPDEPLLASAICFSDPQAA